MIDVDHFKKFNDTYGHQTGDLVLRTVAKAIRGAVRETDTACRYGGEEFAVIAPYASGSALKALGERVRKHIEKAEIETEAGVRKVTASIGAAALVAETGDRPPTVLVECADKALYEAKREGRNRVALHDDV
jgi:diguanylate cyclase (GGDEF)-like protein